MAAPSGIVWGSIAGGYGRIGIYIKLTSTATQTTRHTEIWFWSKYSVQDGSNTFYYDDNATSATTSKGAVNIATYVETGEGWSTSNQQKIAEYDYTFTRGTSASTRSVAAKLTGVAVVDATMTAVTTYTIPALASYVVKYNANGGSGEPSNQTKWYGKSLTLSSAKPTRTGYDFQGWATSASGSVVYDPGDAYTANAAVTLYAVWKAKNYTVSYNANGGSGAPGSQTKTYGQTLTLSSTKPTRTGYDFQGWATSASGSVAYQSGANYTANAAVTLYAVWKAKTYIVKYDANGGGGAPSSQTKTYGQTLTLSNTKPTKAGHSFQGWATSASGSVAYQSGANYTANAAVTLYAVWKANTYAVTYNANGGSGAPEGQTKTYGQALTLSNTKPTRANYTFKGWATSAAATSVTYAAGASYTANAAVTLYAVWELSYVKPKINGLTVARCDSSGATNDEGTHALVKFNWATSVSDPTARIEWKATTASAWTEQSLSLSGTSGTVSQVIGNNALSVEKNYSIRVTVDDGTETPSLTRNLPGAAFPIDVLKGGTGVAVGKPAEVEDTFDCGFLGRFRKDVYFGEKTGYHDGKPGVHIDSEGFIHIQRETSQGYHPYIGFYLDDATDTNGQIRVNSSTKLMEFLSAVGYKFGNHIYLPKTIGLYSYDPNGNEKLVFQPQNNDGNTVIGYGNYEAANGNTNIYGNDINFGSAAAGNAFYRPYYRKGDSISVVWNGTGFLTSSGTTVYFTIPLCKPVIGSVAISAATVDGFKLRQYNSDPTKRYTHGSAADKWIKPSSYGTISTSGGGNHILMSAVFNDTTNANNNAPIGIQFSGTITFS